MKDQRPSVKFIPLGQLKPWGRNYRRGEVGAIIASIKEFGFNGALRVWNGEVMAGNHALQALTAMRDDGLAMNAPMGVLAMPDDWHVPCINISHLSRVQAEAFAIADNRTQELGTEDAAALSAILSELLAVDERLFAGAGYSESDLEAMLGELRQMEDPTDVPEPQDPDSEDFGQVRPQLGDVWRLGPHKLLCADSRVEVQLARLFGAKRADLLFTDPPYGVGYVGKTADALTIENDDLGDEGTRQLVADLLRAAPLKKGGSFYICSPAGVTETAFRLAIADAGMSLRQCIVWVKDRFVLGRSDYHWRHESILYGWKSGSAHFFTPDRTKDTVWEFERPSVSSQHPTMKPVPLIEEAIDNSSKSGQLVYDACIGSGSTLMACESKGRRCYGADIDPRYCEVTLRRWEELTGGAAELVSRV
jgi:DNA modification methylase